MKTLNALIILAVVTAFGTASAATVTVTMKRTGALDVGDTIGLIEFIDTASGLKIIPNLHGLTEGQHGFHVHQNPACGPAEKEGKMIPGLAAGGHFDGNNTGAHGGPKGMGHLGDLPVLYVDAAGRATTHMLAPRLKTSDLAGRSIMIHAGGDNYSDVPKALGGGGARVACGVVVY
jgi:Cu-Zn family superoxide dismutase